MPPFLQPMHRAGQDIPRDVVTLDPPSRRAQRGDPGGLPHKPDLAGVGMVLEAGAYTRPLFGST